jgi:outer membrane protein assembly factor BamD
MIASCSPAMPPENATPRGRFDWSVERYESGKYHDAIRGFRDHLIREPLHPTADSSRLLLAESYLATEQELLAANEFQQLATSRPNSPLADDAQFGVCRAFWAVSPDLPRDQEFTGKAVEECTRLMEFFPRSPLVEDARELVAQARQKMAAKELRVGKYYYERNFLESAIIYFENILQTYPEAEVVPETMFVLYDSYDRVGFRMEAEAVLRRLNELYPDSPQAVELREKVKDKG